MIQSAEEFVRLRSSKDVRTWLSAYSEPAPEAVWMDVIARHPELKGDVASNRTAPDSIVRLLAADPDHGVRAVVSRRSDLPADLIERLSQDRDDGVRWTIAGNLRTAAAVRERLALDGSPKVADRARQILSALEAAARIRAALPSINGLSPRERDPSEAAEDFDAVVIAVDDRATLGSFVALLGWLPETCRLKFFDRFYPSASDPGAYVSVQKLHGALVCNLGNHGWSRGWRNESAASIAASIEANRRDSGEGVEKLSSLTIDRAHPLKLDD
jgi:hypothetical protein